MADTMTEITEKEIQRIKYCRLKLFMAGHVGTHTLMSGLPIIPRYDIPTYATDGHKIYANIEWSKTLTLLDVTGTLIHESLHVGLQHHFRMTPLIESGIPEPLIQTALDYVVNAMIIESPGYGKDFTLPEGCLYNPGYSGWSAEQVIKDLMDNGHHEGDDGYPGPSGLKGDDGGGMVGESGDSGEDSDDQQKGGSGQESDDSPSNTSQSSQSSQPGNNKTQENICKPGNVLPAPEVQEGSEAVESAKQDIRSRILQAREQEEMIGTGSGSLISTISDCGDGQLLASNEVGRFIEKTQSTTRSFARPNRRFLQRQMYLPTPKNKHSILHVCMDTSGSVGESDLKNYLANIKAWASDLRLDLVRVAYVDSEIHRCEETGSIWHDHYLHEGSGAASLELVAMGGGGTSFDPIFEAIEDDQEEVSALIYMTDGCGSVSVGEPDYPVLWLISKGAYGNREPNFYRNDSWGEIIKVNR